MRKRDRESGWWTKEEWKLREIKANLFLRVPIYVAGEELPAVFRVLRHCHFYFRSVAPREEPESATRESICSGSDFPSISRRKIARGTSSSDVVISAVVISYSRFSIILLFNRGRETDFSPRADLARVANELFLLRLILWGKCVLYFRSARERRRRRIEDFNFETRWNESRSEFIVYKSNMRTGSKREERTKIKTLIGIWVLRKKIIINLKVN